MAPTPPGGSERRRVTTRQLIEMKERGEKIAMLTGYDYLFARMLDECGVDAVLVGDSLGQVILGYSSTVPVTLEEMIHHARAVRRGVSSALLIVDMPFLSYQVSDEDALRNAGRVLKETGAEAVKLEGGGEAALRRVRALVEAGVPVMGHLGLTPQSVHQLGGYALRGREREEAERIVREARALQEAGCFSLVLEMVPSPLAARISESLSIPTIGIGAGPDCDGQVLVLPDMLGLHDFRPRFVRRFGELGEAARVAVDGFIRAVRAGEYPSESESYDA